MVILYVLAGVIVVLAVVLILRGRRHPRAYGPESADSLAGKADLDKRKADSAAIATRQRGGFGR